MSFDAILDALAIPADSRVSQRIPKKLLSDQGGRTATDRRQIQEGIDEILWVAALKQVNVGFPVYRDQIREYLEVAILTVQFRESARQTRLTGLIHRAIPYPVFLVAHAAEEITVSLAHKRWSQGESGKTVIERVVSVGLPEAGSTVREQFLQSLPLTRQPTRDLFCLYQGWIEKAEALMAAQITGNFTPASSEDLAAVRRSALEEHWRIEREIVALRGQAEKERQVNRLAQINLEIRRLKDSLSEQVKRL